MRSLLPVAVLTCGFCLPLAAADTPPSGFDLGRHHRTVSTKVAAAQKAFDEGLIWTFAFNHGEAERAYREAARLDPGLAMAWWGVALVNGPHINNPYVDETQAKTAWEALGEARQRLENASPVERALIEALAARYAMPQPEDRRPLDEAYAAAMAEVFRRFPGDADVATLYAEALMDVRPWDQWTRDGQPQPGTAEVLEALAAARRLEPDHPGALHLTIHALEASPQPELAREAADRLRELVPDAGHLVHMPAHIDVRLGRWADAAVANEKAMAADARYRERRVEPGFWALYMVHNAHFLAYAAMMEGRRELALARMRDVVTMFPPEFVRENALFLDAFMTSHMEAQKRFGRWEELLAAELPVPGLPVSGAYRHFARGVAFAALGKVAEAEAEAAAFRTALAAVPDEAFWGTNPAAAVLAVAVPYLDGEIALRKGDLPTAVAQLTSAVELEDALKYDEPPAWMVPSRHALGAVLLAADRAAEAELVYRADLVRYPENGWSLRGLADAVAKQGRADEAAAIRQRFTAAWARADVEAETSCLCVEPEAARQQ
jgi:tetratricopeptide (TPR) repeat protein